MSKLDRDYLLVAVRGTVDEINHFKAALDDELDKLKDDVEEFKKKRDYIYDFIRTSGAELHRLQTLATKVDNHITEIKYTIEDIIEKEPRKNSEYILNKIKDLLENVD